MRSQTGEGVSHYVPVSETLKMVAAAFCAMSFAQQAGWLPGCGAGVTTANRTRIWRAVAPARSHKRERLCQCLCALRSVCSGLPLRHLKTGDAGSGLSAGTPYFVARDIPCEMCEDIPCAKVCPSGALDREIESIDDARMGLAVLVDQENCLNFQGCAAMFVIANARKLMRPSPWSWSATRVPVSTPAFCRRFTATPVPVAVSAKKYACWNNRQSRCYRCHWRKGS
ncbi:ferredoxin-type protein [Escherichia coli]|uniref:Ferredoxin-type protein n=1 Tax=Escherichia coli TaxID=562 RepID=A0A376ZIS2_ECOLX|nr:ferredoxin-type protein [Escherichia coli]